MFRAKGAAFNSQPGAASQVSWIPEAASAESTIHFVSLGSELRFQRLFAVVNRIPGVLPQVRHGESVLSRTLT